MVKNLRAGDVVTIEFPLKEKIERWSAPLQQSGYVLPLPAGTVYTMKFKGNTLIEITPPLVPGTWLYQDRADKYKAAKAPMRSVTRYVADQRLQW